MLEFNDGKLQMKPTKVPKHQEKKWMVGNESATWTASQPKACVQKCFFPFFERRRDKLGNNLAYTSSSGGGSGGSSLPRPICDVAGRPSDFDGKKNWNQIALAGSNRLFVSFWTTFVIFGVKTSPNGTNFVIFCLKIPQVQEMRFREAEKMQLAGFEPTAFGPHLCRQTV